MMKIRIELPNVGRKRLIGAGVLCATASTLWIYAAAQRSALVYMPLHVMVGIGVPLGVALVTLLCMERRIARELRPSGRPQPERERAMLR